jgi:hypothetical protein
MADFDTDAAGILADDVGLPTALAASIVSPESKNEDTFPKRVAWWNIGLLIGLAIGLLWLLS